MFQIYAIAAGNFARQRLHWSKMDLYLALLDNTFVPDLEHSVSVIPFIGWIKDFKIYNAYVRSSDGWCYADPIEFGSFVMDRPCRQAVIYDGSPPTLPLLYAEFPEVPASTAPRKFSLLFGTNGPGWFRL